MSGRAQQRIGIGPRFEAAQHTPPLLPVGPIDAVDRHKMILLLMHNAGQRDFLS